MIKPLKAEPICLAQKAQESNTMPRLKCLGDERLEFLSFVLKNSMQLCKFFSVFFLIEMMNFTSKLFFANCVIQTRHAVINEGWEHKDLPRLTATEESDS